MLLCYADERQSNPRIDNNRNLNLIAVLRTVKVNNFGEQRIIWNIVFQSRNVERYIPTNIIYYMNYLLYIYK